MSEAQVRISPQSIDLSDLEKKVIKGLYEQGEKVSIICESILNNYHPDLNDALVKKCISDKITSFAYNTHSNQCELSFSDLLLAISTNNKDMIWLSFKKDDKLQVIFYTFKANVERGSLYLVLLYLQLRFRKLH